jgi:hypothetical protein
MEAIKEKDEPMLNYKTFFTVKNFDDTSLISAVAVCESFIVRFISLWLSN